jgi:hypothetical protein
MVYFISYKWYKYLNSLAQNTYFEPIWNNSFTTRMSFLDSATAKRTYATGLSELTEEQSSLPPELTVNKTKFRAELTNLTFLLYRFIVGQIYYSLLLLFRITSVTSKFRVVSMLLFLDLQKHFIHKTVGIFFKPLGVGWIHLARRPLIGLLYQPLMIDDDECGAVGGMRIGRGNRSTRRKPVPVHFVHHKSHISWPPGSNPGRRGGKPATNRLSYGTASTCRYVFNLYPDKI